MTKPLRETLFDARARSGMSQEALGAKLGITGVQVSRIETGKRGTTPAIVSAWLEACGYRMETVSLGDSPQAAALVVAMREAGEDAVTAAIRLLSVWPRMTPRERRLLLNDLAVHEDDEISG